MNITGRRNLTIIMASWEAQRTSEGEEAIRVIQANRHQTRAVLLHLADRYVGDLSESLIKVFGVQTEVRQVMISESAQRHILERRLVVSKIDADHCASRLAEALQHLTHWGQPQPDRMEYIVIAKLPSTDRHLKIPLKFVPGAASRSRRDEWWICTAFPFGKRKMRQSLATGKLRLLQ